MNKRFVAGAFSGLALALLIVASASFSAAGSAQSFDAYSLPLWSRGSTPILGVVTITTTSTGTYSNGSVYFVTRPAVVDNSSGSFGSVGSDQSVPHSPSAVKLILTQPAPVTGLVFVPLLVAVILGLAFYWGSKVRDEPEPDAFEPTA